MKRLDEYTNEELLNLDTDEYENLIDLECANAGVRLKVELPKKPVNKAEEKDLVAWHIPTFIVKTEADAMEIVNLINSKECQTESYTSNYKRHYLGKRKSPVKFEQIDHYSEVALFKAESLLVKYEAEKKEYDEKHQDYEKVSADRTKIINRVNDKVTAAKTHFRKIEELRRDYFRYLKLSDGQTQIAFNFLLDSRPTQREEIESLKTEIATELITKNQ